MSPRKPGKSFAPSRAHKEKALEHIRYEIERVCKYGYQTPWQGLYGPPDSYKTPLFESFMLHVRSLLGFFRCGKQNRHPFATGRGLRTLNSLGSQNTGKNSILSWYSSLSATCQINASSSIVVPILMFGFRIRIPGMWCPSSR